MSNMIPEPGIICPDCGHITSTLGNQTTIPCGKCIYKRHDKQTVEIADLKEEIKALENRFMTYGEHMRHCAIHAPPVTPMQSALCDCGFFAAMGSFLGRDKP